MSTGRRYALPASAGPAAAIARAARTAVRRYGPKTVAVSPDEARELALALPEAVELDHHGRPSFRVGGRIFATLWSDERLNVMLDEGGIRTAVESSPDACELVWWGKRLSAVGVTLACADRRLLAELLEDAWEHRAPTRLLSERRLRSTIPNDPRTSEATR